MEYNQQEIDKHKDQNDLWVKMGKKVLDVSQFKHPGGNDKLLDRAGKDVYEDFVQTKHSSKAEVIASNLIIGEVAQEDRNQAPISSFLSASMAFGPEFGAQTNNQQHKEDQKGAQDDDKSAKQEKEAALKAAQKAKADKSRQQAQDQKLNKEEEGKKQRHIDFQELQKHTTHKDLWLLIDGKVYNVSKFKHPGGKEILVQNAGGDATQAFEDQNHTQAAQDQMKQLYIGQFKGIIQKQIKGAGGETSTKNKLVILGFLLVVVSIFFQYFLFAPAYQA